MKTYRYYLTHFFTWLIVSLVIFAQVNIYSNEIAQAMRHQCILWIIPALFSFRYFILFRVRKFQQGY